MANSELNFNGYTGSIEVSVEDNCLHGRILFIDDLVTYEGENVAQITSAFRDAVNRYVTYCKETGKQPNKPYSGSTNVRIGQERHRALAQLAFRKKASINDLICQAVDLLLSKRNPRPSVAQYYAQSLEGIASSVVLVTTEHGLQMNAIPTGTGSLQLSQFGTHEDEQVVFGAAVALGSSNGIH